MCMKLKDPSMNNEKSCCLSNKKIDVNKFKKIQKIIKEHKINTVCKEAKCPNCAECWSLGTATFLILGLICTRGCRFCAVDTGNPHGRLDLEEPSNCAQAVKLMGLKHVVITSVDRDDLIDGGAQHYANCVQMIKKNNFNVTVEVLTPDFQGNENALSIVLESGIDVFGHNLETVERVTPIVRDRRANYNTSLKVLSYAKQNFPNIFTKSGLMLGLGETELEVLQTMDDLRKIEVDILTLGQYLQPTPFQFPVHRHILPDEFNYYRQCGLQRGFKEVLANVFVRSSYRAKEIMQQIKGCSSL